MVREADFLELLPGHPGVLRNPSVRMWVRKGTWPLQINAAFLLGSASCRLPA